MMNFRSKKRHNTLYDIFLLAILIIFPTIIFALMIQLFRHPLPAALSDNIFQQFMYSPGVLMAFSLLLFLMIIVWIFKQENAGFIELKRSDPSIEHTVFNKQTQIKEKTEALIEQADFNIRAVAAENKKKAKRHMNVLETAFAIPVASDSAVFIPEGPAEIESAYSEEPHLLNSINDIRLVNEQSHDAKVDAFYNTTETEKINDELIAYDFGKNRNSEEIAVFIREFEHIMSDLDNYTQEIVSTPKNMENLVQFKSSIHFIKVLSNMMQAVQLQQFSSTIIDFLEEILDGNTAMTNDISKRLLIAVTFYNHYIHWVKENHDVKMEA